MSGKSTTELARIRDAIQSDINKLCKVRDNIGGDLRGIGGDKCVSSINRAIKEYKKSLEWLDKLKPVVKEMDGESGKSSGGYGGGGHGF